MFHLTLTEIIGYAASVTIALSMLMTSIVRLRSVILVGNIIFIVYGVFINAMPIILLNTFNAGVNIFFLAKIYSHKELFKILCIRNDNRYLLAFLDFHKKEIEKFNPGFVYNPGEDSVSFFILRDMHVAGVFLAKKTDDSTLLTHLDFVIPEYRDYKIGKLLFHCDDNFFATLGYKSVYAKPASQSHGKYLEKMGFVKEISKDQTLYKKFIVPCKN